MIRTALIFLVAVLLQAAETAAAQSLTDADAKAAQILREDPDYGILIADVSMRDAKGNALPCGTMTLGLAGTEKRPRALIPMSAGFSEPAAATAALSG